MSCFDVDKYNVYYDGLYAVENALLVGVLVLAAVTSSGGWRRLYLHLLAASVLYGVNSQLLDRAAAERTYYSGSLYDVPLVGAVAWIVAAALSSRQWELKSVEFHLDRRWKNLMPQLAMLAILSLPVLGLWTVLFDALSCGLEKLPHFHRTWRHAAVGILRIPSSVSAGPDPDVPAS